MFVDEPRQIKSSSEQIEPTFAEPRATLSRPFTFFTCACFMSANDVSNNYLFLSSTIETLTIYNLFVFTFL